MTRHENDGQKPRGGTRPRRDTPLKRAPKARAADPAQADDGAAKIDRQRIAKVMARAGLCSRRDAEAWIVEGRVSVNGVVLTSPALDVAADDLILVDGVPMPAADKTRLFLFHKPRGLITSDHDPEGRATIFDYLGEHWPDGPRVVTIGRLDINTEGLLLLTNDGGLARILELPQTGWVRRYRVRAKGETDQAVLDTLAAGVTIDGIDYAGIEAKLDRVQGANCWLTMGLREGKNREVKRVLEHIGLEVNRLIRLSFGPFQLLDLPEGHVEEVKTRILRDQLGPSLAASAGVDFTEPDAIAPIVPAPTRPILKAKAGGKAGATPRDRDDKTPAKGRKPERDPASRGRNFRERDREDEAVAPEIRERPVAGPRRHVSTLRAQTGAETRSGPRKRLERSDTTDRKNRTVKVERLVSSAPPAPTRRSRPERGERVSPGERHERSDKGERRERSGAPERRERPGTGERRERSGAPERRERPGTGERRERSGTPERRERTASPERRERPERAPGSDRPFAKEGRASPSALAKRTRIARSGGADRDGATGDRKPSRPERSVSDARPARSAERPARRAAPKAAGDERSESRSSRPTRSFAAGKPGGTRGGSGRPATGRSDSGRGDARRSSERPARGGAPGGKAPGRSASSKSFGEKPARGRSADGGKPARTRPERSGGLDARRGGPPKGAPRGRPGKDGPRPPRSRG